jgi:hypothetical protein
MFRQQSKEAYFSPRHLLKGATVCASPHGGRHRAAIRPEARSGTLKAMVRGVRGYVIIFGLRISADDHLTVESSKRTTSNRNVGMTC